MSRKIAIVGNGSFPLDAAVGGQVVDIIRGFQDCTILTRKRPTFDLFVQHCTMILGIRCLTYDAEGGQSNIERDHTLIADATELHAFLCLDDFEQGAESGTSWLVERALAAGLPTFAYSAVDGALIHVGSPAQAEGA